MAWTKAKTAIVASVAVILAAGTTTTLVVYHQHQPEPLPIMSGQTEFPRTSWVFAGYADPQSAFMSYLWASTCQSDRKIFEASLTPAQKSIYEHMITTNMKVPQPHSAAETVTETFRQADDQWQNGSYRIIDQEIVSDNQVLLHLESQQPKQKMEVHVRMKKIGNEWRFDGVQKRRILAPNEQP